MLKHTALLAAAIILLAGCTAPPLLVTDTARPSYRSMPGAGNKVAASKTYQLGSPWHIGALQVLRGASITLTPDGQAVFSCTVRGRQGEEEAALRILAKRADGTVIFQYPENEHAYLRVKHDGDNTPYDIVFGFDPRGYASIQKIEWQATAIATSSVR